MSISRDDVGSECNTARRKFWEKCASREPVHHTVEVATDGREQTHYLSKEDEEDVASWADRMLAEWDKRWIVNATDDDDMTQANEVLP